MKSGPDLAKTLTEDDFPGLGRYVWRPEGDGLVWSDGLVAIYGRTEAPRSEAEFMACLHPDDRTRIEGETEAFLTGDADSYSHNFRIVRPDGEVRYIIDRARIKRDAAGRVTEIRGLNVDVTDFPHLARESMDRESARAKASAADVDRVFPAHDLLEVGQRTSGLALADIDYRAGTLALSSAAARLYGLGETAMTVPRDAVHATFHPEDRAALQDRIDASLNPETGGHLETEHRIIRPDGSVRWLQVRKRVDFDTIDGKRQPDRGILAAVDITERMLAEAGLRESEERLLLAQKVAGIGVWDVSLKDGRTVWSDGIYDLLQIDRETPPSSDLFFEKVHPEDVDAVRSAFEAAISEKTRFRSEFRVVLEDGNVRHMKGHGDVTEEEDGRAARILGVNYDITDRKLGESRLRQNEAQLRLILDETVALVGIVETDGTLREANRVALTAGGLSREEVIGKPFWDAPWWTHDPGEVARLKDAIQRAAAGQIVRYDARVKAGDGTLRTMDFSLSPVYDQTGAVALRTGRHGDVRQGSALHREFPPVHFGFRSAGKCPSDRTAELRSHSRRSRAVARGARQGSRRRDDFRGRGPV